MGWKYIIFENTMEAGGTKFLFPVIFPDKMVHSEVAAALRRCQPGWHKGGVVAVSAGMIEHVTVDGLHGSSETLKLDAKEGDAGVIDSYSYGHGII